MEIEPVRQINIGGITADRFGDKISSLLASGQHSEFYFSVAYMRTSGLNRLSESISTFSDAGGEIAGAVGVDSEITSIEALEELVELGPNSTVYSTITNLTYHPKVYLFKGEEIGSVLVGSANLTRDGLYRNVEFGTLIHFDLSASSDRDTFQGFVEFVDELLDTGNANVQPITEDIIERLAAAGFIESEETSSPPSGGLDGGGSRSDDVEALFPSVDVSPAPPSVPATGLPGSLVDEGRSFIMELSASDCSHRTGTAGTPMVLIPKDAIGFFPGLQEGGSTKAPDTYFEVRLNTPNGPVVQEYRFWYYGAKEEFRFRVKNEMIDLTTEGGGDLMVVTKVDDSVRIEYEVTIVKLDDPRYETLLDACDRRAAGDKKWGLVSG